MNIQAAAEILVQLSKLNVLTVCLCPGARNAPFVKLLSELETFEVIPFFDERSAGFFALGRARRDSRPVVICTTSGTAVSELLSPTIEAFYSNTPIIILSADRPKRLRGTGAPQAINQFNIFNEHVEKSFDIDASEGVLISLTGIKPIHINMCFDEPLMDLNEKQFESLIEAIKRRMNETHVPDSLSSTNLNVKGQANNKIKDFFKEPMDFSLVVIGALQEQQRKSVENFLGHYSGPIFAESLSGLKDSSLLKPQLLTSGEKIVCEMIKKGEIKSVLRIGDVPLGRYWRDLDLFKIPVINISDKEFGGLDGSEVMQCRFEDLNLVELQTKKVQWTHWKERDEQQGQAINLLIKEFPLSEPALFAQLNKEIAINDQIYLGNSLPIREWDLVSRQHTNVYASRGVNGIDGQLSTAVGFHNDKQDTWAILGDLTTLYDFSGFWLSSEIKKYQRQFNLVVINNKGGQIFSRLFKEKLFLNQHNLDFSHLAQMWGWNYINTMDCQKIKNTQQLNLIEVVPNPEQSQQFWQKYDRLWEI